MTTKKKELVFSILLIFTAIIWGSAYSVCKEIQQYISQSFIIAIRFSIAALGLGYYVWQARKKMDRTLIQGGLVTGILLFLAFLIQTSGLNLTTASKNAILSQTNVVFVPLLLWLFGREKMTLKLTVTVTLCFLGILIISPPELTGMNTGDAISLLGGFFYGAHIVAVAFFANKTDIMPMTCLQFAFAALFSWSYAFSTASFPADLPVSVWLGIAWLAIMSTLVAMTLMNLGIKYVSSTKTTIILSTESLFGCMFGIVIHNDPLTMPILIGGAIVLGSVLLSQLDFSSKKRQSKLASTSA